MNPLDLLARARKAVPFLDFAFGVVGLSAAAALIGILTGHSKLSIIAIALVFIGSVVLYGVAGLATAPNKSSRAAGQVLLWAVILFFLTFLGFTVSAFAVGYPCNWADFLDVKSACNVTPPLPPQPPATPKAHRVTVEGNTVTAFQGGRDQPNPGCPAYNATSCVTPKNGGRLVKGSGFPRTDAQTPNTDIKITLDTEEQICFLFTARTGACEHRYGVTGRASAVAEYYK
jgi:hypothetical protein